VDHETESATCAHFLRTAGAQRFAVLAYCLMPDHLHALVEAEQDDCDFVRFVDRFKQKSGFAYKQRTRETLWQARYFDRALRDEDAPLAVASTLFATHCMPACAIEPRTIAISGRRGTRWKRLLRAYRRGVLRDGAATEVAALRLQGRGD